VGLARRDALGERDQGRVGGALGAQARQARAPADEVEELARRQAAHAPARPPRALAEERGQRRHEQRADDEGVDDHADGHHEGELAERAQRDDGQQGERGRQRQPGHRDRARRLGRRDRDRLAQAHAPGLVPDAPGDEDVVVRAQRDEQHCAGERDVVRDVVLTEDALEEDRAEPERR